MNKRLIGITILALLVALVQLTAKTGSVPAVFASKLAGIVGAGSTGVQVQNLDGAAATDITMDLYPQSGAAKISLMKNAAAGGSVNFYLPSEGSVADGAYAAVISAIKPIAAIARTEWPSVGGAATYGNVPPSMNVLIPLATKAYYGWTSQFSVQNTDTAASANIQIKVYQTGQSSPTVTVNDTVLPGTSKTYDLATSSQFDTEVSNGFLGSIVVTGDKNLAVQSFVDKVGGSKAVYAFSGLDAASAAAKLYAPLVRRAFAGATTGISIVNPNATGVTVNISYKYNPASGDLNNYTQSLSIAANSSAVAYQGTGPMPPGWLGSAVLDATGPIVAMVNDETATTSAAYNAPSAADGGNTISVPLVRNKQTTFQFTTGVQVMNIGAGTASVSIAYKTSGGTSYSEGPVNVAQYGSYTFYQPAGPFPVGAYGSATVTSSEDVVVIVNDISLTGAYDAAIYNGIKAD